MAVIFVQNFINKCINTDCVKELNPISFTFDILYNEENLGSKTLIHFSCKKMKMMILRVNLCILLKIVLLRLEYIFG